MRNLRNGEEVFLVGTAHISKKSADEVRSVIRSVKPDTVFLELCDARAAAMRKMMMHGDGRGDGVPEPLRQLLTSFGCVTPHENHLGWAPLLFIFSFFALATGNPSPPANARPPRTRRAPGDMGEKLLGASLKAVYQIFRMSGLDPGLEFKVALEEADRIGAKVVLGDRSQDLTIHRLRAAVTMADVMKYAVSGGEKANDWMDPDLARKFESVDWKDPESAVELMKTRRAVRALTRHMREEFPRVATAMVDERDDFMTEGLLRRCGGRTVAVVGMAHMDGIERRWREAQGGDGGVTLIS